MQQRERQLLAAAVLGITSACASAPPASPAAPIDVAPVPASASPKLPGPAPAPTPLATSQPPMRDHWPGQDDPSDDELLHQMLGDSKTTPRRPADKNCCKGKNPCKGQSGCRTGAASCSGAGHGCAGQNQCKGTGTSCPKP